MGRLADNWMSKGCLREGLARGDRRLLVREEKFNHWRVILGAGAIGGGGGRLYIW